MIKVVIHNTRKGIIGDKEIREYTITNKMGLSVSLMNYGATITSLYTPNKDGEFHNIVLGFDNLLDYQDHPHHFGGTIGRVAGRINKGKFLLEGKEYQLDQNENWNHLHGGKDGFDTVIWDAEIDADNKVVFHYLSKEGENGYPGNLDVYVSYQLTDNNDLNIQYAAKTDKTTLFNPTNHVYFNLNDETDKEVKNHVLKMKSSAILETTSELIPTGKFSNVEGTIFDFQEGKFIYERNMDGTPEQAGFDHAFILEETTQPQLWLISSESGREVVMSSDFNCVVVYTGIMFNDTFKVEGIPLRPFMGVTLEAQDLPDAVNHEQFGNVILEPTKEYQRETSYHFDVKK